MKPAEHIQPGDIIRHLGRLHRVTRIGPYLGKLVESGALPADTRIAYADGGWAMTLVPGQMIEVVA